jgi:hypothetical protein
MKDLQVGLRAKSEIKRQFDRLCELDHRSQSDEFEYLVAREWARQFSTPTPMITIEQALEASK